MYATQLEIDLEKSKNEIRNLKLTMKGTIRGTRLSLRSTCIREWAQSIRLQASVSTPETEHYAQDTNPVKCFILQPPQQALCASQCKKTVVAPSVLHPHTGQFSVRPSPCSEPLLSSFSSTTSPQSSPNNTPHLQTPYRTTLLLLKSHLYQQPATWANSQHHTPTAKKSSAHKSCRRISDAYGLSKSPPAMNGRL